MAHYSENEIRDGYLPLERVEPLEATPLSPEEAAAFEARRLAKESEAPQHITPEQAQELAEHIATIDALEKAVKVRDEQEENN